MHLIIGAKVRLVWIQCGVSVEVATSLPPKHTPTSPPPSLGETNYAVLTSAEVGVINLTASVVTIITGWHPRRHSLGKILP